MKKPRYKDQKIKSYKKRVVFLIMVIFILILVSFFALKKIFKTLLNIKFIYDIITL